MKNIKLVIFDLDGVITETSNQHYLAWKDLANELHIDINLEFNETLKGVSRMESLERILIKGNQQDSYSFEEKIAFANQKNERYVDMIRQFTKDNLFEGILELLQLLKVNNVLIALGSASKNGPRLLHSMEIDKYFDYIVDPSTVKGKPYPDIFLDASKKLDISPQYCIGIEDAYSGVEAIKRAKMFAIGIGDKTILSQADIIFQEVKDINIFDIDKLIEHHR